LAKRGSKGVQKCHPGQTTYEKLAGNGSFGGPKGVQKGSFGGPRRGPRRVPGPQILRQHGEIWGAMMVHHDAHACIMASHGCHPETPVLTPSDHLDQPLSDPSNPPLSQQGIYTLQTPPFGHSVKGVSAMGSWMPEVDPGCHHAHACMHACMHACIMSIP